MNLPKISIITASFNSSKTIRSTFDSILAQDYENIEYIVMDGLSTDNTVDLIQKYQIKFGEKLKWKSERDNGIYDAWNKALEIATGDWLMFLGSDDLLADGALSKLSDTILKKTDANFISSRCKLVTQELEYIRTYGQNWSEKMMQYCTIAHVGSLHHKSLFNNGVRFNINYKIAGDYDFLLRSRNIIKPVFLPQVTAIVREGGISGRNIFIVSKERMLVKIANNTRFKALCYFDHLITIFKFYARSLVINPIMIKKSK